MSRTCPLLWGLHFHVVVREKSLVAHLVHPEIGCIENGGTFVHLKLAVLSPLIFFISHQDGAKNLLVDQQAFRVRTLVEQATHRSNLGSGSNEDTIAVGRTEDLAHVPAVCDEAGCLAHRQLELSNRLPKNTYPCNPRSELAHLF